MSTVSAPRVLLVAVSPLGTPGLLGASTWDAVRQAGGVLVSLRDPAWRDLLTEAGATLLPAGDRSTDADTLTAALSGTPLAEPLVTGEAQSDGTGPEAALPEADLPEADLPEVTRPAGAPIVWLVDAPDLDAATERALTAVRRAGLEDTDLRTLAAPVDPPGAQLLRSVQIMDALRSHGGDAWSAGQTHRSLARYLLEESHEVLDVIEQPASHPAGALTDELGDILFQIVFHARLGQEAAEPWSVDDVARSLNAKMERRNPHVFGTATDTALEHRDDVEEIVAQWHGVKAAEGRPAGLLDGVPTRLPALQRAAKAVHRARSAGTLDALLATADRAVEDDPALAGRSVARALLDLVVEAEARDEDPESSLRTLLGRLGTDATRSPQGD